AASHSISAPRQPISAPPTPPTTPTVRSDHPPPVCVAAPSKRVLWTSLRFRRKTLPLPGSWTFTTSLLGRELAPLALNGIVNARQSEVPVSFAIAPAKPSVRENTPPFRRSGSTFLGSRRAQRCRSALRR